MYLTQVQVSLEIIATDLHHSILFFPLSVVTTLKPTLDPLEDMHEHIKGDTDNYVSGERLDHRFASLLGNRANFQTLGEALR